LIKRLEEKVTIDENTSRRRGGPWELNSFCLDRLYSGAIGLFREGLKT